MKPKLFITLSLLALQSPLRAAEHWIHPGDSPQAILDRAAPGDRLVLPGGKVGPGESFDAEDITIQHTRTINPKIAAYLLGHPSFRGHLRNVRCNYNYMETGKTAIEPNFNLDGYEVIGNVIKIDGQAIHCWRHSAHGVIADNLHIHDNSGKPVVVVNAPAGWRAPAPPLQRNNRNHLGDGPVK